jgi:hypothetical protein
MAYRNILLRALYGLFNWVQPEPKAFWLRTVPGKTVFRKYSMDFPGRFLPEFYACPVQRVPAQAPTLNQDGV